MSHSLRSLSDSIILSRLRELVARERAITLQLLVHLNEVERRKLHLKLGHSSMFDYCTIRLGYSEPAAARRIRTARCIRRFPEVYSLLESNEVSMTAICRVSHLLTDANKDSLLARIRGRSRREVDEVVAELQPISRLRDVIRPVVVRASAKGETDVLPLAVSLPPAATIGVHAPNASPQQAPPSLRDDVLVNDVAKCRGDSDSLLPQSKSDTAIERCVRITFTADKEFQKTLQKVRSIAWHRLPKDPSLEHVFKLVLDAYIDRHDPCARHERRLRRQLRRKGSEREQS